MKNVHTFAQLLVKPNYTHTISGRTTSQSNAIIKLNALKHRGWIHLSTSSVVGGRHIATALVIDLLGEDIRSTALELLTFN